MTIVRVLVLAFMLAIAARAEEYWIAYEGNDFPENVGWYRVYAAGGAQRSIQDGILVLDGSASVSINDLYGMPRASIDPGPNEQFRSEWRCAIDQLVGTRDPGIAVFSDQSWGLGFTWSRHFIRSGFEFVDIPFEFVGMHEFVLTSTDMRQYQLFADGDLLREGNFVQVASRSTVTWGDSVEGAASVSRWDYVRFGVVPEPATAVAYVSGLVLLGGARARAAA
jgi:hypothetical protein